MQLCRLVYYSTYNISSQGNDVAADLKHVLASAIRSNSESGLSGGLIFNRRFFAQVLEGDHAVVMQTFARIYKDRRQTSSLSRRSELANACSASGLWATPVTRSYSKRFAKSLVMLVSLTRPVCLDPI
jgi:Sensors of blue-light using FAD